MVLCGVVMIHIHIYIYMYLFIYRDIQMHLWFFTQNIMQIFCNMFINYVMFLKCWIIAHTYAYIYIYTHTYMHTHTHT